MPKPYSHDLRERVIAAVAGGPISARCGEALQGERQLGNPLDAALAEDG
jgi:hypothetical protein